MAKKPAAPKDVEVCVLAKNIKLSTGLVQQGDTATIPVKEAKAITEGDIAAGRADRIKAVK